MSRIRGTIYGGVLVGSVVALSGCGGSGSPGGGGVSLIVEPLKLTAGNTWSTGSVSDDGLVFGKEGSTGLNQIDSFWPTANQIVTIPNIDSQAFYQNIDGITPDQKTILGNTIDINNSGGPGRGFVYSRTTGKFHVLKITSSSQEAPFPESIQADGTVLGWTQAPNSWGNGGQQFVYNLSNDTYTLTTPGNGTTGPGFPAGATIQSSCQSANHRFIGGNLILNGHNQAAIWDLQATTYRVIGPKDGGYEATAVSNDGTVAVVNTNLIGQPYYLADGGKLIDLIALCRTKGLGATWQWLNFISLSPSGNYLTFTGENMGGFDRAVRIRIH